MPVLETQVEEHLQALEGRMLVIFDGECGFCNRSIRWMLRGDGKDRLRFTPSSALLAAELLSRHGFATASSRPDSIVVVRNVGTAVEELLVRSNAVLACLRVMSQPWPIVAGLMRLVPWTLREAGYRVVSRLRYRMGSRLLSCPIPTPRERAHFL